MIVLNILVDKMTESTLYQLTLITLGYLKVAQFTGFAFLDEHLLCLSLKSNNFGDTCKENMQS